ncbi:MAG: hypothetical protein AAFN40_12405 [Cyanobacteria bacterium J06560_6]
MLQINPCKGVQKQSQTVPGFLQQVCHIRHTVAATAFHETGIKPAYALSIAADLDATYAASGPVGALTV